MLLEYDSQTNTFLYNGEIIEQPPKFNHWRIPLLLRGEKNLILNIANRIYVYNGKWFHREYPILNDIIINKYSIDSPTLNDYLVFNSFCENKIIKLDLHDGKVTETSYHPVQNIGFLLDGFKVSRNGDYIVLNQSGEISVFDRNLELLRTIETTKYRCLVDILPDNQTMIFHKWTPYGEHHYIESINLIDQDIKDELDISFDLSKIESTSIIIHRDSFSIKFVDKETKIATEKWYQIKNGKIISATEDSSIEHSSNTYLIEGEVGDVQFFTIKQNVVPEGFVSQ